MTPLTLGLLGLKVDPQIQGVLELQRALNLRIELKSRRSRESGWTWPAEKNSGGGSQVHSVHASFCALHTWHLTPHTSQLQPSGNETQASQDETPAKQIEIPASQARFQPQKQFQRARKNSANWEAIPVSKSINLTKQCVCIIAKTPPPSSSTFLFFSI